VLLGEIFPTPDRAEGSSAGSTVNWAANFAVSLAFLPLVNAIGQGETFWLFAVVCAFGVWFVGHYVPETRDRNFGEIDKTCRPAGGAVLRRAWRSGRKPTGRKLLADAWPLLQGTAAAMAAWVIATHLFDHHQPFYAPIAAVVALTALGERGLNALQLLVWRSESRRADR
jgi:peptidoglycan/LPS O-acetylase OafA/YrhL